MTNGETESRREESNNEENDKAEKYHIRFGNLDIGKAYNETFSIAQKRIKDLEDKTDELYREKYRNVDLNELREELREIKKEISDEYMRNNLYILQYIKKEQLDWELKLLIGKNNRLREILKIDNAINELEEIKTKIEEDVKYFGGDDNAPSEIKHAKSRIDHNIKELRKKRADIIESQLDEIDERFLD